LKNNLDLKIWYRKILKSHSWGWRSLCLSFSSSQFCLWLGSLFILQRDKLVVIINIHNHHWCLLLEHSEYRKQTSGPPFAIIEQKTPTELRILWICSYRKGRCCLFPSVSTFPM
jgi:hypothetical protein